MSNKNKPYGGNAGKRQSQVEQGAYDGRFRPRVVADKKKYSRNEARREKQRGWL